MATGYTPEELVSIAGRILGARGGRKGGKSQSEAKQKAVRLNGKKGGRPRKTTRVKVEVSR